MKYTKEDIHFDQITPRGFENLCYDLLIKYGYRNVIWRDGGADNGRDIEGEYTFTTPIKPITTKWFFECKHYTAGVPPEVLNSKIAWADAEKPDFLVILITSYLSNNARTWLELLVPQKQYQIICIEGEELKDRLINYPELIERYFSQNRYDQMLKDIKDYKTKFNISPSYEILKEIIENIDLTKLEVEDSTFILFSFYEQYKYFEGRNDYYGDFDGTIVYRILEHLRESTSNEVLSTFMEYADDNDALGGNGMFDEMVWIDDELMDEMEDYDFQYYELHLNPSKGNEHWKIGLYLFIIHNDVAFEIFKADSVEIRIIKNFTPSTFTELSIKLPEETAEKYKTYREYMDGV